MKMLRYLAAAFAVAAYCLTPAAFAAATPGGARLTASISDLAATGSASHYTVVWVTKADNTFVTTLWKQGASSFTSGNWTRHFVTWSNQRGTNTFLPAAPDGYTSATATSYAPTDPSPPASGRASNPINITWNGKDATGAVVPDGDYKFWISYSEDAGTHGTDTGGLTTGGLLFTKGPSSFSVNPPNQGSVGSPSGGFNFTGISIVWTPSATTVAPAITSAAPTASGTVGQPYSFTVTATGTPAPTFAASGLPTGLSINPTTGLISGTPSAAGTFNGTITAANGTLPNGTQNFSIAITNVTFTVTTVELAGNALVIGGSGPANGTYQVISSGNLAVPLVEWLPIATNSIGTNGTFTFTNTVDAGTAQRFYKFRVP